MSVRDASDERDLPSVGRPEGSNGSFAPRDRGEGEGIERPHVQLTDLVQGDGEHDPPAIGRDRHLGPLEPSPFGKDDLEADRERLLRRLVTARHGESDGGHGRRGSDRRSDPAAPAPGARDRLRPRGPRQGVLQLADRLPALGRVLGQAGQHHLLERGRGRRLQGRDRHGLRSRIAAITLAALLPSKACCPVSIS